MSDSRPVPSSTRSPFASIAPTRSRTQPSAQPNQERTPLSQRLQSNPITGRRPHGSSHHHHRHNPSHHKERAKETVQSAIELKPPVSFDQILRRDKSRPESSRRGSGSLVQQQREDQGWQAETEARQRVGPEDVARAKSENAKREEELGRALKHVEELGLSSARQFDDTFYSILEKATVLRSTVASMQQLAEESRRMHKQFQRDTATLQQETQTTIASFGGFEEQEKSIDELVGRLKDSKMETQKLNERLEAARSRVEEYEKHERAQQSKRRKQWHATCGSAVGIVVLIIAILFLNKRRYVARTLDEFRRTLSNTGDMADEHIGPMIRPSPSPSEDPHLRELFDEL